MKWDLLLSLILLLLSLIIIILIILNFSEATTNARFSMTFRNSSFNNRATNWTLQRTYFICSKIFEVFYSNFLAREMLKYLSDDPSF